MSAVAMVQGPLLGAFVVALLIAGPAQARRVDPADVPLMEREAIDISTQPKWKLTARRRRALTLAWGESAEGDTRISGMPAGFGGVRLPGRAGQKGHAEQIAPGSGHVTEAPGAAAPIAPPTATPAPVLPTVLQDGLRMTVSTGVAQGQAGYIHYFVLDRPDNEREIQVGIELPDQRIAWSFPDLGVVVSDFIGDGEMIVKGRRFGVQHLYAIRPFNDDAAMQVLRDNLIPRVVPWVDDQVAYCEMKAPKGEACLSCLGFVLRILFPGQFPDYPKLPAEFGMLGNGVTYTTEDLLIYLAGLHRVASQETRFRQIADAMLPAALREELIRLSHGAVPGELARGEAAPVPAQRAQPAHTRPIQNMPPSGPRMGTRPVERKRL